MNYALRLSGKKNLLLIGLCVPDSVLLLYNYNTHFLGDLCCPGLLFFMFVSFSLRRFLLVNGKGTRPHWSTDERKSSRPKSSSMDATIVPILNLRGFISTQKKGLSVKRRLSEFLDNVHRGRTAGWWVDGRWLMPLSPSAWTVSVITGIFHWPSSPQVSATLQQGRFSNLWFRLYNPLSSALRYALKKKKRKKYPVWAAL